MEYNNLTDKKRGRDIYLSIVNPDLLSENEAHLRFKESSVPFTVVFISFVKKMSC